MLLADDLFDQDDALGTVMLLPRARGELTGQDADVAAEAVGRCPAGALRVVPATPSSAHATQMGPR